MVESETPRAIADGRHGFRRSVRERLRFRGSGVRGAGVILYPA